MNGSHSRFAGHTIEFLQSELRVANRHFDARDEAVRISHVSLNGGIVEDSRQVRADIGRHPLPRHAARDCQKMHLDAVLVHPFAPLVQIEVKRIGIEWIAREFDHYLAIGLGYPMSVDVDGNRPAGWILRRQLPGPQRHHCARTRGEPDEAAPIYSSYFSGHFVILLLRRFGPRITNLHTQHGNRSAIDAFNWERDCVRRLARTENIQERQVVVRCRNRE
jgi:hypothetical protein